MSYLQRHWRGELRLGRAFWINFIGLFFAVQLSAMLIGRHVTRAAEQANVTLDILRLLSLLAVIVIVFVWGTVGVWRSSQNVVRSQGARLLPYLARLGLALGACLVLFQSAVAYRNLSILVPMALETDEDRRSRYEIVQRGNVLAVAGMLEYGLEKNVRDALEANPEIRVIQLESPGGRIVVGRRLRDLIAEKGLSTYTYKYCASSCTLAFLAGRHRTLHPDGKLGFHQYLLKTASHAAQLAQMKLDRQFMASQGIDEAFVRKVYETPSKDMWTPRHEELLSSGYVTRIAAQPVY